MKHPLGSTWQTKTGELLVKTETGTQSCHRYLVELYLGFPIPQGFSVHHINFNHSDNRLENLMLLPTPLHTWLHRTKNTQDLFTSNLEKIKRENILCQTSVKR